MRRSGLGVAIALLTMLAGGATSAAAQDPNGIFGPYDGQIPFKCELQYVGAGTEFPDPDADPFCVEYDKTSQNVNELGIVEFLSREPARVAAAVRKCFYFQRDHWTGSIVQGSEPELYHWDGDYWFDGARGVGGGSIRNLRIGGEPADATPYIPPSYWPYLDENGGGGAIFEFESDPPTRCTSRVDTPEERDQIYAGRPDALGCIEPRGNIRGLRIGRIRLGMRRAQVRARLGPPTYARPRIDAWCLIGKGELRLAYGARGRAQMALTSGSGHSIRGVSRGDRQPRAHRRLRLQEYASFGSSGVRAFYVRGQGTRRVWVGIKRRRVRWLLLAKRDDTLAESTFLKLVERVP